MRSGSGWPRSQYWSSLSYGAARSEPRIGKRLVPGHHPKKETCGGGGEEKEEQRGGTSQEVHISQGSEMTWKFLEVSLP